jgi:uncharacterized RDD family membrane protein YckC
MSAHEPYPPTAPHPPSGPTPIGASDLLASRGRRFFALCIDLLIYLAPMGVVMLLLALAVISDDMTDQEQEDAVFAVFAIVFLVATSLYLFVYLPLTMSRHGERNGQTLGKQALGVRVVTAEGVPVSYGRVMRRELLGTWVINWVTGLYSIVDYGFGLFDNRRQCLHDKIASTYVIKEHVPFGDGRPLLPPRHVTAAGAYAPPPSTYGQPAPPYGQAPAPPYGQQPSPPYGQQPSPPYGQQPAPPYTPPAAPPYAPPAAPPQQPAGESLYPREPGPAAAPDAAPAPQEAPPAPPAPPQPAAEPARPQHRWSPPRQGDGNDEARRAFGDG